MTANFKLPPLDDPDHVIEHVRQFEVIQRAFQHLEEPSITALPYHNPSHTLDVMRESILFARDVPLSTSDVSLLLIASAWHDVGFVKNRIGHEEASIELFRQYVRERHGADLSKMEQQLVESMIRDTKLHARPMGAGAEQVPTTDLSRYLLDADLSNLGRDDFFDCLDRLVDEHQAPKKGFLCFSSRAHHAPYLAHGLSAKSPNEERDAKQH